MSHDKNHQFKYKKNTQPLILNPEVYSVSQFSEGQKYLMNNWLKPIA